MKYEIGVRIKKYRKESGLTQEQLGEKINVSKNRISNWEQGLNRPDADTLGDICAALNVSPSDLLNIHIDNKAFSPHERQLIKAYREKTTMQKAVDILLDLRSEADFPRQ